MARSSEEFPLLRAYGLMACDTRGDGNCLFHSLSDQVFGHQGQHEEIRARVIVYMREHADEFKPFAPVETVRRNPKRKNAGAFSTQFSFAPPTPSEIDRAFENHLNAMARGGTYGDNMEIQAFAKAYDTDVRIYNYDSSYYVRAANDGTRRQVAHIAYHTWEHYSSIRNIDGPITGLPEIRIKDLSPEEDAKIKAATPKAPVVQEWMIKAVTTSLPHLVDPVTIRKALEDYNGRVDDAVSKLLDAEYLSSTPGSPGSMSASGSSSIERDPDSDDDDIYGPNKRQNRLLKVTKSMRKDKDKKSRAVELQAIPTIELTKPDTDSVELYIQSADEAHPKPSNRKTKAADEDKWAIRSDGKSDGDFRPDQEDNDIASEYSTTSRSQSVALSSTPPPPPKPQIILRTKSMQKQQGPQKKRITARNRKELKKAAQKQARKESRRIKGHTSGQLITSTANINIKRTSPPIDQVIGIKTLYI